MEARFIKSASRPMDLLPCRQPEIAFIGRSNTGKSSLLNALTGRKSLVRVGSTPGLTKLVNFFGLGPEDALLLVDLPGYGYREAAASVAGQWESLIAAYLERPSIKEFLFLLDCRRVPTEEDLDLMQYLADSVPLLVILTKTDKISKAALAKKQQEVRQLLQLRRIAHKDILGVSSLKRSGIEALRSLIFVHAPQLLPKEKAVPSPSRTNDRASSRPRKK